MHFTTEAEGSRCLQRTGLDSAKLDALRALQEKVQRGGRLPPWLARHGLDGLAALWTRLQVEPGWESALEAALRERLQALEIGRVETVRAFEADPPPARLVFCSLAEAGRTEAGDELDLDLGADDLLLVLQPVAGAHLDDADMGGEVHTCSVQAVAASCRPRVCFIFSRIWNFWILPVTVIGKLSTKLM